MTWLPGFWNREVSEVNRADGKLEIFRLLRESWPSEEVRSEREGVVAEEAGREDSVKDCEPWAPRQQGQQPQIAFVHLDSSCTKPAHSSAMTHRTTKVVDSTRSNRMMTSRACADAVLSDESKQASKKKTHPSKS